MKPITDQGTRHGIADLYLARHAADRALLSLGGHSRQPGAGQGQDPRPGGQWRPIRGLDEILLFHPPFSSITYQLQ